VKASKVLPAVLLAALSMSLIGGTSAAASSGKAGEIVAKQSARNRSIAERDSERRLRLIRLPPGAAPSQSRPSGVGQLLREAPGIPSGTRLVTSHAFWTTPGSPHQALAWLRHHRQPGAKLESESKGSAGTTLHFYWSHAPAGVLSASVLVTVVPRSAGGSAIRADVFDGWELPRSPAARIPTGSRYLGLVATEETGGLHIVGQESARKPRFISTEDGPLIARLVRLINRERAYQYINLPSCGPEGLPSESHLFKLTFKTSRHGRTLGRVSQEVPIGICDALRLQVGSGKTYPLEGGWKVLREVRSLIRSARPERYA
jgi:hypothetical protein